MIIVGSGAIGVEFAHFITQWGQKSRLLNLCRTLFLLKTKIFQTNGTFHEKGGVKIMTNSSVEKIDTSGEGVKAFVKQLRRNPRSGYVAFCCWN
jgi:dihydrolipoamide dehydrogenase